MPKEVKLTGHDLNIMSDYVRKNINRLPSNGSLLWVVNNKATGSKSTFLGTFHGAIPRKNNQQYSLKDKFGPFESIYVELCDKGKWEKHINDYEKGLEFKRDAQGKNQRIQGIMNNKANEYFDCIGPDYYYPIFLNSKKQPYDLESEEDRKIFEKFNELSMIRPSGKEFDDMYSSGDERKLHENFYLKDWGNKVTPTDTDQCLIRSLFWLEKIYNNLKLTENNSLYVVGAGHIFSIISFLKVVFGSDISVNLVNDEMEEVESDMIDVNVLTSIVKKYTVLMVEDFSVNSLGDKKIIIPEFVKKYLNNLNPVLLLSTGDKILMSTYRQINLSHQFNIKFSSLNEASIIPEYEAIGIKKLL